MAALSWPDLSCGDQLLDVLGRRQKYFHRLIEHPNKGGVIFGVDRDQAGFAKHDEAIEIAVERFADERQPCLRDKGRIGTLSTATPRIAQVLTSPGVSST